LAFQSRVVEESLDFCQAKPVGRLSQQSRRDSATAMLLGDAEAADVGPSSDWAAVSTGL
jgi:hypothetical protein